MQHATEHDVIEQQLAHARLAGDVRTTRDQSLAYIQNTLTGDTRYTFGLSDWQTADTAEIIRATEICGGDLLEEGDPHTGWIAPGRTVEGMLRHADALREPLASGGRTVLLATGHPMGLLEHYIHLAQALEASGNDVVRPLDDVRLEKMPDHPDGHSGIRYVNSVACVFINEAIVHTHRPDYMTAMLDSLAAEGTVVDLVIADHGMAGAAIEAGIETLS